MYGLLLAAQGTGLTAQAARTEARKKVKEQAAKYGLEYKKKHPGMRVEASVFILGNDVWSSRLGSI